MINPEIRLDFIIMILHFSYNHIPYIWLHLCGVVWCGIFCTIINMILVFLVSTVSLLTVLYSSGSAHSLPSLRPLMDVNYLPLTDMRIARTFCFTNGGQALYLSSPTEIQRITYSQEMCDNLQVSTAVCVCAICQSYLSLTYLQYQCVFCP